MKVLEKKLLELVTMKEKIQLKIDYFEIIQLRDITEKTDSQGKKEFTNDMMRKSELERLKQLSEWYNKTTAELEETSFAAKNAQIQFNFLERLWKSYRCVLNSLGSE